MGIKSLPLSKLEADPTGTRNACADEGGAFVVELPDHRLVAIQSLEPTGDDSLTDELIESNEAFRRLPAKSKESG